MRKILAIAALGLGAGGIGVVGANLSTIVGATSDAGAMTVCSHATKVCNPGGPIRGGGSQSTLSGPSKP